MTKMLPLPEFIAREEGAITVDWVVLTAAVVGVALAVVTVISTGANSATASVDDTLSDPYFMYAAANFGKSPTDIANEVELQHFGAAWPARRMDKLLNDLPENKLRNQHRTWRNRAADATYAQPGKAADQLAMFEIALEARGVAPHP
ncbi:MAG: hypothetical protein AAFY65_06440 [Pseudomonadota bacterium]